MDDPDDLLISELDEELESALEQADRRALGDIDTNTADAAASAPNANVVQVCPACLWSFLSCGRCMYTVKPR